MGNYKKISEYPEELNEIINFVNFLPKNIDEIYEQLYELMQSFKDEENRIINSERNAEIFEKKVDALLDAPIIAYMYYHVPVWDFIKAYDRLQELVYAKQLFTAIIKARKRADTHIESRKDWLEILENAISRVDKIRTDEINAGLYSFGFQGKLQLDSNWNIKPALPSVVKIFSEFNISVERIRECPVCQNVFWSKRTSSLTCGESKCVHGFQNLKKKEAKKK